MPNEESMKAFVATAVTTDRTAIRAIVAEVSSKPLPDGLEEVSVPVLAVVGDKDPGPPSEQCPGSWRQFQGRGVPEVGHQWNAESPLLFSEMVRLWVDKGALHPDLVEVNGHG